MVVLYILLALLLLIMLLLCIRVMFVMDFQDEFVFEVKWLFIKYKIYPAKEKNKKESAEPEETQKAKKPKKQKQKSNIISDFYHNQGFEGVVELIQKAASSLNGFVKRFVKSIVIHNLSIYARIAGEDAAKTAVSYGIVCSALYPAIGTLCSMVPVNEKKIDIQPDFLGNKSKACFNAVFSLSPIKLINATVIFIIQFICGVLIKLFLGSRKIKEEKKVRKADSI